MKTKQLLIFICLVLSLRFTGFSQKDNTNNRFVVVIDFGGNSGVYSMNNEYEIINHAQFKVNTRIGFGYLPVKGSYFFCLPVGINLFTGEQKHHLEVGLGSTIISGLSFTNIQINSTDKYYADKAIYFVPSVGYRYDGLNKGLIIKLYYSPLVLLHDLLNEDKFKNSVIPDEIIRGNTLKSDYFDYYFGDKYLPKAASNYAFAGISIGYRF